MSYEQITHIINILEKCNLSTDYTGTMAYIQSCYTMNKQELAITSERVLELTGG